MAMPRLPRLRQKNNVRVDKGMEYQDPESYAQAGEQEGFDYDPSEAYGYADEDGEAMIAGSSSGAAGYLAREEEEPLDDEASALPARKVPVIPAPPKRGRGRPRKNSASAPAPASTAGPVTVPGVFFGKKPVVVNLPCPSSVRKLLKPREGGRGADKHNQRALTVYNALAAWRGEELAPASSAADLTEDMIEQVCAAPEGYAGEGSQAGADESGQADAEEAASERSSYSRPTSRQGESQENLPSEGGGDQGDASTQGTRASVSRSSGLSPNATPQARVLWDLYQAGPETMLSLENLDAVVAMVLPALVSASLADFLHRSPRSHLMLEPYKVRPLPFVVAPNPAGELVRVYPPGSVPRPPATRDALEAYALGRQFRGLNHMLEYCLDPGSFDDRNARLAQLEEKKKRQEEARAQTEEMERTRAAAAASAASAPKSTPQDNPAPFPAFAPAPEVGEAAALPSGLPAPQDPAAVSLENSTAQSVSPEPNAAPYVVDRPVEMPSTDPSSQDMFSNPSVAEPAEVPASPSKALKAGSPSAALRVSRPTFGSSPAPSPSPSRGAPVSQISSRMPTPSPASSAAASPLRGQFYQEQVWQE